MTANGLTPVDVAERIEVDPKTVERWITLGRTPYRTHRWKVAQLLGVDVAYLWPDAKDETTTLQTGAGELVGVYPNRGLVPGHLWTTLVAEAQREINVLVYAGLFWFDVYPDLVTTLAAKADAGVRVRLLFGLPGSYAVEARSMEEGADVSTRIRMATNLISPLFEHDAVEIRFHATTLYTSIYHADDVMLANTHVYGAPAARSPVLHLHRVPGGRLFDHYARSYELVWSETSAGTIWRYTDDAPRLL